MVGQKKGRGAKAQAAKVKAAAPAAEEQVADTEVTEAAEAAEENNGQAEPAEQGDEAAAAADGADAQNADGENAEGDTPEKKEEEKVESGKLLVENLPSSYLFDYQEKLKELFSKHGEVSSVNGMERLPDEVLLAVLERLSTGDLLLQAARVCRRWRRLAESVGRLVRRQQDAAGVGRGTRRLLVIACGACLPALLAAAPLLTSLTVHARVALKPPELAALERLEHLRHLDVHAAGGRLGGDVLPAALRLHVLVLNDTPAPGVLRALGAGRLRELHMYGSTYWDYPRCELIELIRARAPHLRELTLRCSELEDADYRALADCEGLRALRLYVCRWLRAEAAAGLARLPHLHTLHVTGARMLQPAALLDWLRSLPPGLRELSLSMGWFGDEHVAALCARVPGLRVLEVWRCGVPKRWGPRWGPRCGVSAPGVPRCGLSARGVRALADGLLWLRELDVDVSLGSEDVAALAAHGVLRRLRCAGEGARAGSGLRVEDAKAPMSGNVLRGNGEGPRADLFYSWLCVYSQQEQLFLLR